MNNPTVIIINPTNPIRIRKTVPNGPAALPNKKTAPTNNNPIRININPRLNGLELG
jgi:hypothetical protein